jgi:hypothetical protein
MNLKQSLHSLLADNETAEVITQLRALTEESLQNMQEEVEQVATRFEANIDQSHSELADELSTNKENARIRYQLLSIINRLPDDAELPSVILQKRSKLAVFIVAGVAILALIAFNFDLFKREEPIAKPSIPQAQTPVAPVVAEAPKEVATPATVPAVAPVTTPVAAPQIVVDTLKKVDTLPKKKVRRVRKAPVVPAEPVLGVSQ